jgi:hypothetical protein
MMITTLILLLLFTLHVLPLHSCKLTLCYFLCCLDFMKNHSDKSKDETDFFGTSHTIFTTLYLIYTA